MQIINSDFFNFIWGFTIKFCYNCMNQIKIYSYQKLDVWKNSEKLNNKIFHCAANFPKHQEYILKSQILRSSLSICANIAEGSGRSRGKDQGHFLRIAFSSLMETECHLLIAVNLEYILPEFFNQELKPLIDVIGRQLNALHKYNLDFITQKNK